MKTAAIVTLNQPGQMSKKGRKAIADWLRKQARDLERLGSQYSDKQMRARYLHV